VKKAVIPAAGLGTRFLPATKAQPKEMLPVVDKPAIQYVVEEAVRAGIRDILIVTGRGKRTLEDHFDRSFELEHYLEAQGKHDELKQVREISEMASIHYIRQRDPAGLGDAVAHAEHHVGGEPFAVLLGDDIVAAGDPLLDRMISVYERYGRSVIGVQEVRREDISLYGAIKPEWVEDDLARVVDIVEKPPPEEAPSNLAAIGRYVLTPEIFDAIRETPPDAGGEVQLTDALRLLAREQAVYAYRFEDGRYDIGKKLDYLRATVELAVDREDLGPGFRAFLADLVQRKKLV
jgi:UTP--glucose-1-phosphate uridylyltransferase